MRIESIYIRGFGKIIEGRFDFPQDRVTLILEDNECGKSTLAAAITAGLCGFPTRRRKEDLVKLKDVYRPWHCDDYYLEMDIETGGRKLRIERDFSRDSFVVRDLLTNRDISAGFDTDLAGSLLRLPREDFQRVAFISGKEVHHFGSSPNIQARFSALVDGSTEDNGASAAIAALENVRCSLDGRSIKADTAAKRLSSTIQDKQRRIGELDAALEAAGDDADRLEQARTGLGELEEDLAQLDAEYAAARLSEIRAQICSAESNTGDVESLKRELNELEPYAAFPAERAGQLTKAAARLTERQAQAESLQNQLRSLEEETQSLHSKLDSQTGFASAADDDLLTLGSVENEIRQALSSVSGKEQEIEVEKRALAAEGVDVDTSIQALERFDSLSPADREFLRAFRETQLELNSKQREAESTLARAIADIQSLMRSRSAVQLKGKILCFAGLGAGLVSLMLFILQSIKPTPAAAITILGIVSAVAGAVQLARGSGLDADRRASLTRESEDAQSLVTSVSEQALQNENRAQSIAGSAGFVNSTEAVEAFKESERALSRSERLNTLRAQLAQLRESLDSSTTRATRSLSRLQIRCAQGDDPLELTTRTREALSVYLANRTRLRELERNLNSVTRDLESKREGIREEKGIIESIAQDARVDPTNPVDQIIKDFDSALEHHRRYREIKDSLLPATSKHVLDTDTLTRLHSEEAELTAQVADGVTTDRQPSQVDNDRTSVRRELAGTQSLVRELDKAVGACVDGYRREYPLLQEQATELTYELNKIARFEKAAGIAAEVMREVSESSYRRWASALNSRASEILPHLNPDYDTLRFDDSLSFTIRHISSNRIIERDGVDAQLSTGAKDQVYLAVRLACCLELSKRGDSIPIILDDPLIAADDSRFERGLKYLVEELPDASQIIILSCHKSRHEQFLNKPWFQAHVSVLDLDWT